MTTKFKAGDKVVRTSWYGGFNDSMKVGGVYDVKGYQNDGIMLLIKGLAGLYDDRAFELFIETPQVDFKNMKFKVPSPEHSKEIQEALFEMGYKWHSDHHPLRPNLDSNYITWICANMRGELALRYGDRVEQEFTIETTKSYKIIPKPEPAKETIIIDGKTYDKEAVLKRLAELEKVL